MKGLGENNSTINESEQIGIDNLPLQHFQNALGIGEKEDKKFSKIPYAWSVSSFQGLVATIF